MSDADVIVEMQHRHRELMHDLKGIYALLINNICLEERARWTPEEAKKQRERAMTLACERLKEIFDAGLTQQ